MACLLFLLLKFLGHWHTTHYDSVIFLVLLAIELPNWCLLWAYRHPKQ